MYGVVQSINTDASALEKALIHCDLEVVNAELITISSSFWQLMNINNEDRIFDVLIRNTVTGCACVITKALMSEYKGYAKGFTMHDHFYAAHAALYNSIYRIPLQLIKYRQHSNNCIGTGKNSKNIFFKKLITKSLRDCITAIQMRLSYDWCKVSALESASFFPKISSSHLKSITSSLDFHYDHSRTC